MPPLDERAFILLGALLLDALIGDPDWLWRRLPHPVALMGRFIAFLDKELNRPALVDPVRRLAGAVALAILLSVAGGIAIGTGLLLWTFPLGGAFEAIVVAVFLAGRSLYDHVSAVANALAADGLDGGRAAVARIVGRDPATLDEAGVCRAAIESCAESFADGIVAPAFWYLIGGLPALIVYKAINTADSMIGYRNETYSAFGWAAARLDDLVNWIPARLTGVLLVASAALSGRSASLSFKVMWQDARKHTSPNAGWPEAAMAGALGIALAGPRVYEGQTVEGAWLHADGRRNADAADIRGALRLLVVGSAVQAGAVAALFMLAL
ncbi:MAG: adenosylcobinamide-phosphate synthase CbiB [Hyphomicrobiales bacterium]|nr:adenosylcobinamide-phosphate synthase CbiB [Hyphomicrobiales bacterium]